ncbi:MAG TPA: endolytic transglycosylase MltG [Gemmatimonadales bacterium]|nr:endolytic transglycosylase MltG [Gemmatimonadales bacterium]
MSASRARRRRRIAHSLTALVLCGACEAGTPGPIERVTVPPRAAFSSVADSLAAHGVIGNRLWFKLVARFRHVDRSIKAGVYELPRNAPTADVLSALAEGRTASVRLTVPEGLTIPEVAALVAERVAIPADSFVAAARDTGLARDLGIRGSSLEGFLRPETYAIPLGSTAHEVARMMVENFNAAWRPEWTARLDTIGMRRIELMALASIVEGEARADDERETIAGVYRNRLRIGMPLQADPTVQYAILLATGKRKPRLYQKDYLFPSPYNTYLHPGLPPGPVNSPSRRSIEAALYPAQVPYLYFVAGPDGRHLFSKTYEEHLRNVSRIRRAEKAAAGKQ